MRQISTESGLTLIEPLVVLVILGGHNALDGVPTVPAPDVVGAVVGPRTSALSRRG